jgi:hypothetical protein
MAKDIPVKAAEPAPAAAAIQFFENLPIIGVLSRQIPAIFLLREVQ